MNRANSFTRPSRGFTLIEAAMTIIIISMLAGILLVAVRKAVLSSRIAAERQLVSALQTAVNSFRTDHGFLPPLIDDRLDAAGMPMGNVLDGQNRPRVRDNDFLMSTGTSNPDDPRYSVYALQWYVMGMLDVPVAGRPLDGAAGPRYTEPQPDGTFAGRGKVSEAKFEAARAGPRSKLITDPGDPARISLTDRWGSNLRYYRWKPQYGADGQVAQFLVPRTVGDPTTNVELRSAEFAIVSLGPDQKTDDRRPLPTSGVVTPAVLGAALDESTRDNIVEASR